MGVFGKNKMHFFKVLCCTRRGLGSMISLTGAPGNEAMGNDASALTTKQRAAEAWAIVELRLSMQRAACRRQRRKQTSQAMIVAVSPTRLRRQRLAAAKMRGAA
jgi:hypothetical protein